MKIIKWSEIYKENQRIDKIFVEKYKDDNKLFEKNCIELLVEIGEFINETKIFKYWSQKQPNKEKMIEEYADVITMILTFYGLKGLEIKEIPKLENKDLLDAINELYNLASKLKNYFEEALIEEIFKYVLYIGNTLNFNENEIINAIKIKQKIIEERLNNNY